MPSSFASNQVGRLGRSFSATWPLILALGTSSPAVQNPPRNAAAQPAARKIPPALNFANGLFRQGKYNLAVDEYERFLKTAPEGPDRDDALYGLANARLFLGKYQDARAGFQKLLKDNPDYLNASTALFRIGETSYLLGEMDLALQALQEFATRYPTHRHLDTAWPRLGDVYFRKGNLEEARAAYEKAVNDFPNGPMTDRARLGLAKTLAAMNSADKARALLLALIEKGARDLADSARFELGLLEASVGRFEQALLAFEGLEAEAPRGPLGFEVKLRKAETLEKLNRGDEAEALELALIQTAPPAIAARAAFDLGSARLARKQWREAFDVLDVNRFADTSTAPAILFRSAEAARKLGKLELARDRLLKLVADFPRDPWAGDALLQAADLALKLRKPDQARALAASFREKFPEHPHLANLLLIEGRAAIDSGKPKDAIQILEPLADAKRTPSDIARYARYYLGLAYRADGRGEQAAKELDSLTKEENEPLAADALFVLARERVEAKRFAEAIEPLEKYLAVKKEGESAESALALLAVAFAEADRAADADAALKSLVERFPDGKTLAPTRLWLAEKALSEKRFDRAAELFRQVADSTDSQRANRALSGLGTALFQSKKPLEAAEAFGRLLAKAPDDPLAAEASLNRAEALEAAEQYDQALAAYAETAKNHPRSDRAAPASLAKARLLVRLKRPAEAAEAFEAFVRDQADFPGLDAVLTEWAWALLDAKKDEQADQVFKRLLKDFPDGPRAGDARLNLAESAYHAKKYDEVDARLAPLVAEGSKFEGSLIASALYRLAWTRFKQGKYAEAVKLIDRLLAEHPDNRFGRESKYLRAESLFQAGEVKAAELAFAALSREPSPDDDSATTWTESLTLRRIQCLIGLERWADALALAEPFAKDLPKDSPRRAELDYARGRALQGLARYDDARAAYQDVIDRADAGEWAARAQLMRGETFFHQKNYREALREYLMVDVTYDAPPWQAAALLEAGKVHERLDQWTDAAEMYERVLANFAKTPSARDAGRRLQGLRDRLERTGAKTDSTGKKG